MIKKIKNYMRHSSSDAISPPTDVAVGADVTDRNYGSGALHNLQGTLKGERLTDGYWIMYLGLVGYTFDRINLHGYIILQKTHTTTI